MGALQERLMSDPKDRLWLSGYTTIESKMVQEDGSCGLSLALRKNMRLPLSAIKSNRNFVAGRLKN